MFDLPTPGLTIHLRYMHFDLDPASNTYLKHYQPEGDTLIEGDNYAVGTQRLPRSQQGRHAFLWAPFDGMGQSGWRVMVDLEEEDTTTMIVSVILRRLEEYINRTEKLMLTAGNIFYPMPSQMADSSDEDPSYSILVCQSPAWQESTSVQALFGIWNSTILRKVDRTNEIEDALRNLRHHLISQPNDSLSVSITVARWYKAQGDSAAVQPNGGSLAIAKYIRAITRLLPYFPSEYYMESWEMRICELGSLLLHAAWEVLEVVAHMPCVTNWEMAKICHLQGRCIQSLERLKFNDSIPTSVSPRSHPVGLEPSNFFKARERYLLLPPGQFARQSPRLFDGLDPQDFLNHYVDFGSDDSLLHRGAVGEAKWYEEGHSRQAQNVNAWLERMGMLQQIHHVLQASKEGEDGRGDLEADNMRLEMSEGRRVIWDYRVEMPEEE